MPNIIHWLFTEAGAGWLVALISLATLLVQLIRRKAAEKLVFREITKESLVIISKEVKEKISITFDNTPVKQLSQLQAEIINSGSEVIRDATITVRIPQLIQLLDMSVTDESGHQDFKITQNKTDIGITIPFLNPIRPHHHRIKTLFVIDGNLEGLQILGAGAGWSLSYQTIEAQRQKTPKIFLSLFVLLLIVSTASVYIGEKIIHVGPTEVSWRAFSLILPTLIIVVIIFILLFKDVKKSMRMSRYTIPPRRKPRSRKD